VGSYPNRRLEPARELETCAACDGSKTVQIERLTDILTYEAGEATDSRTIKPARMKGRAPSKVTSDEIRQERIRDTIPEQDSVRMSVSSFRVKHMGKVSNEAVSASSKGQALRRNP
jgi:hypothetical protein